MSFFRSGRSQIIVSSFLGASALGWTFGCSSEASHPSSGGGGIAQTGGGAADGTGGNTASGGVAPNAGASSNGGISSGAGGTSEGAGGTPVVGTPATFSITTSLSEEIETVAIVQWSLPGETVEDAEIFFGKDPNNLSMRAPVDLAEPDMRTLLLGLKPSTTYSFQILATAGGETYQSEVQTFETGYLANGLPPIEVNEINSAAVFDGYTIFCTGIGQSRSGQSSGGDSWALIFDSEGDYVWAYDISDTAVNECSRARLSLDGKHLWLGNFSNVSSNGALLRVSMDGLVEDPPISLPGRHHDFALLPNGNIVYQEQENGGGYGPDGDGTAAVSPDEPHPEGPDIIYEYDLSTGEKILLYHQDTDFEAQIDESGAHTNFIEYVPHLDAISFSMRHSDQLALISYEPGEPSQLIGAFSGPSDQFGMDWEAQHGHQFLPGNRLIVFSNGPIGENASPMLEFEFDLEQKTSTELPSYQGKVGGTGADLGSVSFGSVHRVPNGNTLITYSNSGVIHEIDADRNLIREISTDSFAYPQHLASLYGPPPPFDPR